MSAPLRLSPTMSSRRLLALEFIERYWAERGASPSFGEIAEALGGVSRGRVHDIVHGLANDGLIGLLRGQARSITLPSHRDQALRTLRAEGWVIDMHAQRLLPPDVAGTISGLSVVPELDHIPDLVGGDQHDTDRSFDQSGSS